MWRNQSLLPERGNKHINYHISSSENRTHSLSQLQLVPVTRALVLLRLSSNILDLINNNNEQTTCQMAITPNLWRVRTKKKHDFYHTLRFADVCMGFM